MRRSLAGLWLFGLAAVAFALTMAGPRAETKDVTFARDVAPIVYENCVYCHRPGEVAPFSLLTYKDARPWARSIKQKVSGKQMPPWKADPHFGEFQNAKILSDRDIRDDRRLGRRRREGRQSGGHALAAALFRGLADRRRRISC